MPSVMHMHNVYAYIITIVQISKISLYNVSANNIAVFISLCRYASKTYAIEKFVAMDAYACFM